MSGGNSRYQGNAAISARAHLFILPITSLPLVLLVVKNLYMLI
jgi:hypothetical protein